MTNYPTILGHEPRFTGVVRGLLPFIPSRIVNEACELYPLIMIKDEKIYRFPLIVRQDCVRRGGLKLDHDRYYRWMLYAIPYSLMLDQIEAELKALNELREKRNEYLFPLLASDISSNNWNCPYLGSKNVTAAPVCVPAFRRFAS